MRGTRTWLWGVVAIAAFALGWAAAMTVNAGASLRNEEDAYIRFRNALDTKNTLQRTETLVKLVKKLTPETLPGATRAFEEDLWPLANSDIRILMAYWARHDPRGMVATIRTWDNSRVHQIAATEAVTHLAATEGFEAARAFYDEQPLFLRKPGLVNLVLAYVDHGDVDDMAGFITSFKDHEERDIVGEVAVERMIDNHGPQFVQSWVEGLAEGRGNTSDVKVVAFRAAQRAHMDNGHRKEFEAWLDEVGHEQWARGGWRAIAKHWVKTEPLAAIEWARNLPEERDRLTTVQEAVRGWAAREPDAAVQWILEQEPNEELDRGLGRLVVHYAVRNPELSLELLERIEGDTPFQNARKTVSHHWGRLPEKTREPLLEKVKAIAQARVAAKRAAAAAGSDPAVTNGAS